MSLRRNLVLPFLLVVSSCGSLRSPDELYREADVLRRRGLTRQAIELATRGLQRSKRHPESLWNWRFRLLSAELQFSLDAPARALDLLRQGGGSLPAGLKARYLADLGFAEKDRGLLDQALGLATREGQLALIPVIELKRANLDGYTRASEPYIRHALSLADSQSDPYLQASALLDLGYEHMSVSRLDEAIEWLERSEALARQVDAARIRQLALLDLGVCYYRLGDFDHSLQSLSRAVSLAGAADAAMLDLLQNDIGDVHYRCGEFPEAIRYYREAADLARRLNHQSRLTMILNNLAATSLEYGDLSSAERFNAQAGELIAKINDSSSRLHNQLHTAWIEAARKQTAEAEASLRHVIAAAGQQREPLVLWEAEAALARLLHAVGRDSEADTEYGEALVTIEKEWANLGEDRHKVTFLAQLIRFYGDYIDFLMAAGQADRAGAVADSSRARVLAEELGRDPGAARKQIYSTTSGPVVLSYWLAPGRSYLWATASKGATHYTLPGEERIAALVKQYSAAIERGHDPIELDNPAGQALFDILVAPARALIPPGASVIVIPDGCLHGLNFETLIANDPAPHYWIEDVTIAVAPAASLLELAPARRAESKKLLFIGDPILDDPDFPPLPHLKLEADIVKRNFPSVTALTGERANPRAYAAAAPGGYSVIHFAAHAIANAESPLNSAILLSRAGGEYKLYAEDVLHQPLNANLVTISACRSAGARSYAGEGLVGFAWAFMQAGARNVIAGLWNADDEATAGLMGELYRHLTAGAGPAQALRLAKLKLLRSNGRNHRPYYWGAFQTLTREINGPAKF